MLILQRPWTEQPQEAAGVDWGNPLARGLFALVSPTIGNAALGLPTIHASGTAQPIEYKSSGAAWAGNSSGVVEAVGTRYTGGPVTVFILCERPVASGVALLSFGGATSSGGGFVLHDAGTTTEGRLTIGGVLDYSAVSSFYVSGLAFYVMSFAPGGRSRFYRSGVYIGGNESVGTPLTASKPFTIGAWHTGSAYGGQSTTKTYLAGAFSRVLSDAEVSTLSANPWQLFALRQTYIPLSTAASGLPTLSAATYVPGSLTASGFRPRVTATY